ncbi:winged helix-turn-helix domain-containing protein [Bowmanella denitrificans]|uniref:nSTAND1 domain-containing NTPase n=1 Tax=Bowmanella denitrificans TaxID=366582 RepID=UPI000C9AD2BE|nr:winged helix-turn-helix domain-containing protein [Bowmanella denitrificans]
MDGLVVSQLAFFLGPWLVDPTTNCISQQERLVQLEPKAMDVLLCLCKAQGQVISAQQIVVNCWGSNEIGDNSLHKVINQLRRALDDSASAPRFIETIRKRGYRILAEVRSEQHVANAPKPEAWQGGCPYPGLGAYSTTESSIFFGRTRQTAAVLDSVSRQVALNKSLCVILGASGTGKSSLINAGVIPVLQRDHGYQGIRVMSSATLDFAETSASRLFLDIASAMLDWEIDDKPVLYDKSAQCLAESLVLHSSEFLKECQQVLTASEIQTDKKRLLLFLDRIEVLLSRPEFESLRQQFFDVVNWLACSGQLIVICACRNDFYPLLANQPVLMSVKASGGHFDLLPPTRSELMQMIRMPAMVAGLKWQTDAGSAMSLDEMLCNDAASHPDSLPMLQYSLQELYLHRDNKDCMLLSVYRELGGIEGAIGRKAEEVYQSLPQDQQQALGFVLWQLISLGQDAKTVTSRAALWGQLANGHQKALVQAMVESRLFVSHLLHQQPSFSLAHEALLRGWTRAKEWIAAHTDSLVVFSRLQLQASRWHKEHQNPAFLLPSGKPLDEALALQANSLFKLDEPSKALIRASKKRQTRGLWMVRATLAMFCLLTLTSLWLSVKSHRAEELAMQRRLEAENLLGFMVGEFADKLRSVKRMDLLDGISNKALEYFSLQADIPLSDTPWLRLPVSQHSTASLQYAKTLMAMGEVAYYRAKEEEARQAFSSAQKLFVSLLEQAKDVHLLKQAGANAFWLGQLAYDAGEWQQAEQHFMQYLQYSQDMQALSPGDPDAWLELSYAHNSLGSLLLERHDYKQAQTHFEQSLKLKERALKLLPDDATILIDRADTLSWLATTQEHLGKIENAIELLEMAQQTLNLVLTSRPDDAAVMEGLLYGNLKQAELQSFKGDLLASYQFGDKALHYVELMIEQDSENMLWQQERQYLLAMQLRNAAEGNFQIRNASAQVFARSLQEAAASDTEPVAMRLTTWLEAIQFMQLSGFWSESGKLIEKASVLVVTEQNIEKASTLQDVAKLALLKASQHKHFGQINMQKVACDDALKLLTPLVSSSNQTSLLWPYVQAHACLNSLDQIADKVSEFNEMSNRKYLF